MGQMGDPVGGDATAIGLDVGGWVARWDAQQAGYMADREGRFRVLFDALEAVVGDGPITVVDLGCGLGSVAARLVDRFGQARVIAVDVDPVLLLLGRGAYGGGAPPPVLGGAPPPAALRRPAGGAPPAPAPPPPAPALLREAGFQAVDVLWRHGGERLLAALR